MCTSFIERNFSNETQIRATGGRSVSLWLKFLPDFMEVDLLLPERQCHPSLSELNPLHAEDPRIEIRGGLETFDSQYYMVEASDMHLWSSCRGFGSCPNCRNFPPPKVSQSFQIPAAWNCDFERATFEPRPQSYPFDNRFRYATYFLPMSPVLDDITDNTDRRQRAADSVRAPEVRILRAIEGEGGSQTSEDFEVL
jgi:hypothetical protein